MKGEVWLEMRPDGSAVRYTETGLREDRLRELIEDLFRNHWKDIVFGPVLEGAVYEIRCSGPPALRFFDGYLTVDFGLWHFHLCLGPHHGSRCEELRRKRPVQQAAFFETRGSGCAGGRSWGLRLWNGFGEPVLTVFLPNPYLDDDMRLARQPDWGRLRLYFELRQRCLGEPMPGDFRQAADAPWPELERGGAA